MGTVKDSQFAISPESPTYGQGVAALRKHYGDNPQREVPEEMWYPSATSEGRVIRAPTFRETLLACVNDYERKTDKNREIRSLQDRLGLFSHWKDTCTGIAHKGGTSKFRIVPVCEQLVRIDPGFNRAFLDTPYAIFKDYPELDSRAEGVIYRAPLSRAQVTEHPGWLAAAEGDTKVLGAYADIVFGNGFTTTKKKDGQAMGFYPRTGVTTDRLLVLYALNRDCDASASGYNNLDSRSAFLRVK